MENSELLLRDFDYNLPQAFIADFPLVERHSSKLLNLSKGEY